MQLAGAIALSIFYVGLSLALGGWNARNALYWFLVPICGVTCCALFVAHVVPRLLPTPWAIERRFGRPPRRVHLSWRTAVRVPAGLPLLLFPGRMLAIASTADAANVHLGWVWFGAVALPVVVLMLVIWRRRREFRLLRDGEVATALVDYRTNSGENPFEIIGYHFITANGVAVSGRAYDRGYGVGEGSDVPVFYCANNPKDHVAACGCWFEVD